MRGSRREFLAGAGAALAVPLLPKKIFAASPTGTPLHGLSAFGDLKYPADFKHFDYVNPGAPKGGTFSFSTPNWLYNQNPQTFNTLNSFVARGDAPPRMEMCFDSLMTNKSTTALDEPDAVYDLLAESVVISEDRKSFEFALRPEARFHDGTPLTAEDAAFTYKLFKEDGHSSLLLVLREMTDAVALDPHRLRLSFSGKHSERTILDAVTFPVLSKAYYTENSFKSGDLKPPLGSGPYKVGRVSPGQTIEYERVADYWGRDLPVNRGAYNFDRVRIDFYTNRQAGFEAFKKGDVLYRQEFTARVWANDYDFPAIAQGRVVKREFQGEKRPSMQAVAINLRRERFQDVRVRRAITMCFDFEWTKRNLFYDSYERSQSCFERSDYKAEGSPSPEELALLEPLREQLPPEVFGEAVMQPVSSASGRDRKLLGAASKLFAEAGWKRDGGVLVNGKGERLTLEFLDDDDSLFRIIAPWVENLKAIGVDASMRVVDAAQMQARQADFDFDLVMMAVSWDATPTEDSLATTFHSRSAKLAGSRNLTGTADPAVDALIAAVGKAADRKTSLSPCGRSTGSCARGRTGFHAGIRRIIAPPSGTCSATRSRSRITVFPLRRCGGSTRTRRRRLGKAEVSRMCVLRGSPLEAWRHSLPRRAGSHLRMRKAGTSGARPEMRSANLGSRGAFADRPHPEVRARTAPFSAAPSVSGRASKDAYRPTKRTF